MIKLVAIDLDGTLLNEQKLISDENKQALEQAKQISNAYTNWLSNWICH